jgi:hypothetical protein
VHAEIDPSTTVTLPASLRRPLRDYQTGGNSAAEALADLMDEVPPDYFRRDLQQSLEMRARIGLDEFRKRHRLPGR